MEEALRGVPITGFRNNPDKDVGVSSVSTNIILYYTGGILFDVVEQTLCAVATVHVKHRTVS